MFSKTLDVLQAKFLAFDQQQTLIEVRPTDHILAALDSLSILKDRNGGIRVLLLKYLIGKERSPK